MKMAHHLAGSGRPAAYRLLQVAFAKTSQKGQTPILCQIWTAHLLFEYVAACGVLTDALAGEGTQEGGRTFM